MKELFIGVYSLVIITLVGIWVGSCERQPDYSQMNTEIQEIKLVKVYFVDGHAEVFQYDYVWTYGEGVNARLQIDGDKKDVYIKFNLITRYEEFRGLESEVTQNER